MKPTKASRPNASPPPHVSLGLTPEDLSAIGLPAINLAVWIRSPPVRVGRFRAIENLRFTCMADEVADLLYASIKRPRAEWHRALAADAAMLARHYAEATGVDRVELRLDRVTGNACSRFHSDHVGVRLITTYAGRGTQWLAQGDDEAAAPSELAPGDVGLFKGRLLAGDAAIVHRSPPIAGSGEERLLLVIDAARSPLEAGA